MCSLLIIISLLWRCLLQLLSYSIPLLLSVRLRMLVDGLAILGFLYGWNSSITVFQYFFALPDDPTVNAAEGAEQQTTFVRTYVLWSKVGSRQDKKTESASGYGKQESIIIAEITETKKLHGIILI